MEDYTFASEQIALLNRMAKKVIASARWNYVDVTLQFDDVTMRLYCDSETTQTSFGLEEAVVARLEEVGRPSNQNNSILLLQDQTIDDIYIVRATIFFTRIRLKDRITQSIRSLIRFFTRFKNKKIRSVDDLLAATTLTSICYVYHPDSPFARKQAGKYGALVDTGIVLQVSDKFLPLFVHSNFWGFDLQKDSALLSVEQLKNEIDGSYKLIRLRDLIPTHAVT